MEVWNFRWFSFSINWVILRRVRPLIFRFRQFSTKPPGGANYFGITEGFTSPSPRLGAEMATLEKIGGWEPPNLDWRKWLEISTHFYEVEWKSPHICPCIQKKNGGLDFPRWCELTLGFALDAWKKVKHILPNGGLMVISHGRIRKTNTKDMNKRS